jgi:hypothetical protein
MVGKFLKFVDKDGTYLSMANITIGLTIDD